MNKYNWIKEIFSEKGVLSSKRVIGALGFVCAVIFTGYLVIKGSCDNIAKDLIETILYVSALLLGVSTVASIWKKGK